ncbi:hypothetical protein [Porphyromonas cangingivalis]|nr:hypothetical protein [Porphyromonas cangingivalis]
MKKSVRNALLRGALMVTLAALTIFWLYDSERPFTYLSMWYIIFGYYLLSSVIDVKKAIDGTSGESLKKYKKALIVGTSVICIFGGIIGIYSLAIQYWRGAASALFGIILILLLLRKESKEERWIADMEEQDE